jgi:hypothetical protein
MKRTRTVAPSCTLSRGSARRSRERDPFTSDAGRRTERLCSVRDCDRYDPSGPNGFQPFDVDASMNPRAGGPLEQLIECRTQGLAPNRSDRIRLGRHMVMDDPANDDVVLNCRKLLDQPSSGRSREWPARAARRARALQSNRWTKSRASSVFET